MKILTLVIFFLFSANLSAQEIEYVGAFEFQPGQMARVFNESTRVRNEPGIESQIIDSLNTNAVVTIVERLDSVTTLGARRANWYKVSYKKDDKVFEGFVWGANFCLGHQLKNDYELLYGILKSLAKYDRVSKYTIYENLASVKIFKSGALVDEYFFNVGSWESVTSARFGIDYTTKFRNVDFIVLAATSGEACGIPAYDQYLLFTNNKLVPLPVLMNVGDADLFAHSENYTFSKNAKNKNDVIFLDMEEYEKDEATNKAKTTKKRTVYLWNGAAVIKQ